MKKSWLVFLSLLLLITALPGMASASESTPGGKVYSEEELDQILIRAGYPDVENLNLADKQFFVENSGEDLRFLERSEVETYVLNNESGEMEKASEVGPFGTIPTTSLNVWFDDFEVYVNGVKHVDVYPRFEWKGGALVKNDSIGVAIPQGWQIISGQNSCQTQFKYYSNPNDSWTYGSDCGGRPASEQTYGMSWQNLSAPIHTGDYPNFIYKGTAFFRVKKTSSSANTRFVGSYAHDASEKATSSYSVGFNWGFISFQLNGSSSSSNKIDTAGFSKNITG